TLPMPAAQAQDGKKNEPADVAFDAAAQQVARDALARFEKPPNDLKAGIRNWKIRIECLVTLAKIGPAAVPVVLDALKDKSAETRAFAAQALGFLADSDARPALAQAVEDKEQLVRLHAIKSLGRVSRLEATPRYRHIADKDESMLIRFEMTFSLT